MDYGLKGKVALVTGTASQKGIGKGICLILAKEGCDIISASRDLEGAKQTATEVKAMGPKAIALKVDVANYSEVDEMVKTALKEFGKIDVLVNNDGVSAAGGVSFLNSTQEMWERDFAVNLFGTMNCAKAVVPGMVSRKYGKIINFSSTAAKMGAPNSYSAAKAAIQAFTRGLATEFGSSGINVNAVAPGMVRTKLFAAVSKEIENHLFENAAAQTPLRRNQTIDDIANAVAFLASDLSKNITGQCLQVDSGMVML